MTGIEYVLALALAAHNGLSVAPEDLVCLSRNVYHEARGESREGQIAVAYVTLNRVAHEEFGETICEVVHDPKQFSWTTDDLSDAPTDMVAYVKAMQVALDALRGLEPDPTFGATFFYNPGKASPGWARRFAETAVIDNHRFMRN